MYENLCLRRNHPGKALDFVLDDVLDLTVLDTKVVNIWKQSLILVSRYMFLTMLNWLERVSELPDVPQHQQHGPGPHSDVTQLPGIIEG